MTFDAIAYGPEEHLLITFDGHALLAHDAQTEAPKWALDLPAPIAAALFADLDTFPASQSSPWRSNASSRWVVAVDVTGAVHVVDAMVGQISTTFGPFGAPTAVAAGAGGRFALATSDRVHVWRSGERTEIPDRAAALAFSNDGASLAIGGGDGSLRFVSVATGQAPVETFCAVVHGGINDLVQHPSGAWLVAGRSGMFTVTDAGPQRLVNMPQTTQRVRFDARGAHLAVQLAERSAAVYAWPGLEVETRIEYIERPIRGLSFGPGNWLGVGLDHGDGNKIDFVTTTTHRTDTHPGRVHRSWMLSVRGKEATLSAREADDIRRMKDPFHTPAPAKVNGGSNGGRVGIGVGIGVALMFVRVILTMGGSSHSYSPSYTPSYTPPYSTGDLYGGGLGTSGTKCDVGCAKTRIGFLQVRCANDSECVSGTTDTLAALRTNNCTKAKIAFARITRFGQSTDANADVLDGATYTVAKTGLDEACGSRSAFDVGTTDHAMLIKLEGPEMNVTTEDLPSQTGGAAATVGRLWAAPDGTLFAATLNRVGSGSAMFERKVDSGDWRAIDSRHSTRIVEMAGRSATSLPFIDYNSMGVYDGKTTHEITPPSTSVYGIATSGDDLLVLAEGPKKPSVIDHDDDADDDTPNVVFRRKLPTTPSGTVRAPEGLVNDWKLEPTIPNVELMRLFNGPASVWAIGSNTKDDKQLTSTRVFERLGGRWLERRWWGNGARPDERVETVWVTPTNDAFVGTTGGIYRSTGGGAAFTKTPDPLEIVGIPRSLWGRSSTDVFAATADGLLHFDGKGWAYTPYRHDAMAVTGTKTDVYALTTSK